MTTAVGGLYARRFLYPLVFSLLSASLNSGVIHVDQLLRARLQNIHAAERHHFTYCTCFYSQNSTLHCCAVFILKTALVVVLHDPPELTPPLPPLPPLRAVSCSVPLPYRAYCTW